MEHHDKEGVANGGPETTPDDDNDTPAEAESTFVQHTHKKRTADRQITKDDRDSDEEEGQDSTESNKNGSFFPKASKETLQQRRIVKVKRPAPVHPTTSSSSSSTNPFAAAVLVSNKSSTTSTASSTGGTMGMFGAAFAATQPTVATTGSGGFGVGTTTSSSTGFGAAAKMNSSSNSTGFGSSTTKMSSGFGNFLSNGETSTATSIFASGAPSGFAPAATTTTTTSTSGIVEFPEELELVNGEEGEECLFTIRAKLFELRTTTSKEEEEQGEMKKPAAPSVPPSSSRAPVSTATAGSEGEPEEKGVVGKDAVDVKPQSVESTEESEGATGDKDEPKKKIDETKQVTKSEAPNSSKREKKWHEVGIGPLRVLERSQGQARIVQRREATPGGPGHKLLLNVSLRPECRVLKKSDKHVQLDTTSATGEACRTFLFKVGAVSDAQKLQDLLKEKILEAGVGSG